jgi:RNA polymerase sigma-70 factor (ECF subfamily)
LRTIEATAKFHEFIWPHRDAVLRVARILSVDEAEADDLAQETMLKAYKGIDTFVANSDGKAWLMTILRRSRIDRIRASACSSVQVSLDAMELEPAEKTVPDVSDVAEIWAHPETVLNGFSDQQIIEALKRLPEEIRLTLLLVDVEGLDQRDAASILEVPVGTIKSRAYRGRAMLRETLLPIAREMRLIRD